MANSIATGNHPSLSDGGSTITKNQVAHGFSLMDGIYHDGVIWVKAQANDGSTVATYCISEVTDVDNFKATKFGSITAVAHGFTIGQYYYSSTTIPGTPTLTAPTTDFNSPLFYVEDADIIHMLVHRATGITDAPTSTVEISDYNSSEWIAFTPAINNMIVSSVGGFYRRVGDSAEIRINTTITSVSGFVSFFPPPGLAMDTTKTANSRDSFGSANFFDSNVARYYSGTVKAEGSNVAIVGDGIDGGFNWGAVNPTVPATGDSIDLIYTIPIVGWEDKTISTKVVTQTTLINPNILINGDFRVNQRGILPVTGYSGAAYHADRWRNDSGVGADIFIMTTLQPNQLSGSKSIRYTAAAASGTSYLGAQQPVEDFTLYKGKVLTLSAWVKSNNSINKVKLGIADGIDFHESTSHSGSGNWELLTLTANINSSATQLLVKILAWDGGTVSVAIGDYVEFTGAKLELSEFATEFVADSYADSLRKCQRHYWDIAPFNSQNMNIIPGTMLSATLLRLSVPAPVAMYNNPIITLPSVYVIRRSDNGNLSTLGTITLNDIYADNGFVYFEITNTTADFNVGLYYMQIAGPNIMTFEAEL